MSCEMIDEAIDPLEIDRTLDALQQLIATLKSSILSDCVKRAYQQIAELTPVDDTPN